jgi:hypothetical protein
MGEARLRSNRLVHQGAGGLLCAGNPSSKTQYLLSTSVKGILFLTETKIFKTKFDLIFFRENKFTFCINYLCRKAVNSFLSSQLKVLRKRNEKAEIQAQGFFCFFFTDAKPLST